MTNIPFTQAVPATIFSTPKEGPRFIPYDLDFNATPVQEFDFQIQYNQQQFTTLQTLWVDNSTVTGAITILNTVTGQVIVVPASTQGYFPLLQGNSGPKFKLTASGAVVAKIAFLNFYIDCMVWKTV